ncbi:hypothetical protein KHQ82_09050 [Mycoplasmatota bacterium]|nr:hypothetical protein KHQ82_09050 [Mycoplasmatota bacterium]
MKKIVIFTIVILVLILGGIWFLNYQSNNVLRGDYYYGGHMMGHYGGSYWPFGMIWIVVCWVIIYFVVAFIYRLIFQVEKKDVSAQKILDNRLANGDITIEEYNRIKSEIERGR